MDMGGILIAGMSKSHGIKTIHGRIIITRGIFASRRKNIGLTHCYTIMMTYKKLDKRFTMYGAYEYVIHIDNMMSYYKCASTLKKQYGKSHNTEKAKDGLALNSRWAYCLKKREIYVQTSKELSWVLLVCG